MQTVNNCIFTNNKANNQGGAIYDFNGNLTLNGCNFTNNTANLSFGGAIYNYNSILTLNGCNFTNNTANSWGGAICNAYGSTLNMNNCTFSNNIATNQGGAIANVGVNAILNGSKCTFINNSAVNNGGAIYNNGITTVNFSSFINNTSTTGSAINLSMGTVNAQNNWWGSNNNPSNQINGTVDYSNWLYMTETINPTVIVNGSTTTVTVSFNNIWNGTNVVSISPANGSIPDGTVVNITSILGTFNPTSTVTTSGIATTTFTATNVGTDFINATTNNQTVSTLLNVNYPVPVANFTADNTNGTAPQTVKFTDLSTGNVTSYNWDFGDNNTSTDENPTHVYSTPGNYTVTLTVIGPGGNNTETFTDYIMVNWPAPIANFTSNITNGTQPLNVQFNDQSTGNVTSYNWDFGDNNTSTDENPTHVYNTPGNYTVTLTVIGPGGNNTETFTDYIMVNWPAPIANFTANTTNGTQPLNVQFNDQSTGNVTSYNWDFGDGNTSTDENPTHVYNIPGTYTVTETVTGPGGNNTEIFTDYITVNWSVPVANFTVNSTAGIAPETVHFTDESTGNITSYAWDFNNDGIIDSTEQNPTWTYNISGIYTVTETVDGPGGNNSETFTDYITINPDTTAPIVNSNVSNGLYNSNKTVKLTATDNKNPNPKIYYTIDGFTPTTSSTQYNNPIIINKEGTTILKFIAVDIAGNISELGINNYTIDTTAPTADANIKNGLYNKTQNITLSMNEAGTIYYTTNDTTPTTSSTQYNGPISITKTTTLKFLAVDLVGNMSSIYSTTYTIDTVPPTASSNVKTGLYNITKTVTLSMNKIGTIYYTLNGTTPTTTSNKYTGPITIKSTATLKYLAVDLAGNKSPVYTNTYTIDKTAPKVASTTPANNAKGVSLTSTITIKFNEKISKGTKFSTIYIKNMTTGKIAKSTITLSGNTISIKMTSSRFKLDNYQVYIPTSAVKDTAGNNNSQYALKFKTI